MRALILLLAAVPACTLYEPADDDSLIFPDAWSWSVDARPWMPPDAPPDDGCAIPLPCPNSDANRFSICGRVHDVETGGGITNSATVSITFHDLVAYVDDPTTSTPLVPEELTLDDCGRFRARNLPVPQLGYLGVVVDDAVNAPDNHRATIVSNYAWNGGTETLQRAYALRSSTDDAWASQVNLAQSFADQGAILALFTGPEDRPAPNVRITADDVVRAADDFYFSTVSSRTTLLPSATTTNPNGAALMLNSALVQHSGTGGEPNGCVWSRQMAAAIPGTLWVQPIGFECPI